MADEKNWNLAWAKFDAFRAHLPNPLDEGAVALFHAIVQRLEESSGEHLADFRIPDAEMKQQVVSIQRAAYGRPGSGRVTMSEKRYCNLGFMEMQIDGIARYFRAIEARNKAKTTTGGGPIDYWSMNDTDLETLARKYNIPPWSRAGEQGEHWYVDRDRIIDELVNRDTALKAGQAAHARAILNADIRSKDERTSPPIPSTRILGQQSTEAEVRERTAAGAAVPTVFISYSHDSPEHEDRVLALANRLRTEGVDAMIDQYLNEAPAEGWRIWMENQIRNSDFVPMVCSETYFRRVMKQEEAGHGLGACYEAQIILQVFYEDRCRNTKFLPVFFEDGRIEHVPTPLRDFDRYSLGAEEEYVRLYRRITRQPATVKPELGILRSLPPHQRGHLDFIAGGSTQTDTTAQIVSGIVTRLVPGKRLRMMPIIPSHRAADEFIMDRIEGDIAIFRKSDFGVAVPFARITEIVAGGLNELDVLILNGRIQWVSPSQEWKFFLTKPTTRHEEQFGLSKYCTPQDLQNVKTALDRHGYRLVWVQEDRVTTSGMQIVYDDHGFYLRRKDRPSDAILMTDGV